MNGSMQSIETAAKTLAGAIERQSSPLGRTTTIRLECLRIAASSPSPGDGAQIVARAQRFERYILGDV